MDRSPARVTSVRLQDSTVKRLQERGIPLRDALEAHAWAEETAHKRALGILLNHQEEGSPLRDEEDGDDSQRNKVAQAKNIGVTTQDTKVRVRLPAAIRSRS